jgi:hypothetical protein
MYQVRIEGLGRLINQIEKFDQDVSKELKKELGKASDLIVAAAKTDVRGNALSGWGPWTALDTSRDLSYNPAAVASGIKKQAHRYRRRGVTVAFGHDVVQMDPAGAIYEFAGSKNESGEFFAANVVAKHGPVGKIPRRLGKAYYKAMPEANARILAAIEKAQKAVGK